MLKYNSVFEFYFMRIKFGLQAPATAFRWVEYKWMKNMDFICSVTHVSLKIKSNSDCQMCSGKSLGRFLNQTQWDSFHLYP